MTPVNITANYTLTLDQWLEANRLHRNPIHFRNRHSSLALIGWFLLPLVCYLILILLNFASKPIPPQVLNSVMPHCLSVFLIASVVAFSHPVARKTASWFVALLLLTAVGTAFYLAYKEYQIWPPSPQPDRPDSPLGYLLLLPWAVIILAIIVAVNQFIGIAPQREWNSSPAQI